MSSDHAPSSPLGLSSGDENASSPNQHGGSSPAILGASSSPAAGLMGGHHMATLGSSSPAHLGNSLGDSSAALETPYDAMGYTAMGGSSPMLGGSSPLSLLRTPGSQNGRATPNSLGGLTPNSLCGLSARSRQSARSDHPDTEDVGPQATIWGSNVHVQSTADAFKRFFKQYTADPDGGEPYYDEYLKQLLSEGEDFVNLDCTHLREWCHQRGEDLYEKLLNHPGDVVAIIDNVLTKLRDELPDMADMSDRDSPLRVRPFNLDKENRLRDLDPSDIDKLVSVKGMVTRTGNVIPDMTMGLFECSVCGTTHQSTIENNVITEPDICSNMACQAKDSMRLLHNRSHFLDKQVVRLQEAPEHMPEGETPQTVSMCVYDRLVDVAKPGDRVEITGIYRANPVRVNPRHRTVRSLYKTHVDIVHVKKLEKGRLQAEEKDATSGAETQPSFVEDNELDSMDEARVKQIQELSQRDDLYEALANALAPSVWELDDIKKGILLQLFGGRHKKIDRESAGESSRKRGEINVLMCGDPGTSKSQLLQYVHKVAPRGIYTSGKGSSAVGLTAYVTKDPDTKEFVLESGALVLSDRGVCCIDEFDKMSDAARSILHEAMEQQTVSIAKAGIICSLNARTSVLAAANPVDSKYDPKKSVVENINLPPSLISRFDLIYLVLDKPNERTDTLLANHLVALYRLDRPPPAASIDQRLLMEYMSYARREIDPEITDAAAEKLINTYVEMRGTGAGNRRVVTATPRQLESLIRLGEAHARMRLSHKVEAQDVDEALRLMRVSLQSAAMDPRTGTIDMDLIATGRSASARSLAAQLAQGLKERFMQMSGETWAVDDLRRRLMEASGMEIRQTELREALGSLEREHIVQLTRNGMSVYVY